MKIRVLGAFGAELPCCNLTGFLINDCVMIDAGTITGVLSVEEQAKITHVVMSHAHLDHTRGIPFMADNVIGRIPAPVQLVGVSEVLEVIEEHLLNNKIWPDFTRIPDRKAPVLQYKKVAPGRITAIGGRLKIKPVFVNHTVPCTGFIIWEGDKAVVYSGDTKPTDALWKAASKLGDKLKAVIIEASFPNRMQQLADLSGHLTPQTLGEELKKIKGYTGPVYVYHVKSQYLIDMEREIGELGRKGIIVLRDEMHLDI